MRGKCQKVIKKILKLSKTSPHQKKKIVIEKRKKNLIIGSSVLKGITNKGLRDTNVVSKRGAHINQLTNYVAQKDLSNYKNINLQIGGNDIAYHCWIRTLLETMKVSYMQLEPLGTRI